MGIRHFGASLAAFEEANTNPSPRMEVPDRLRIKIPTKLTTDIAYAQNIFVEITSEVGHTMLLINGNLNMSSEGDK